MKRKIGRAVNRVLAKAGIRIVRLGVNGSEDPYESMDPVAHYSVKSLEEWYSNFANYTEYVTPERRDFYRNIVESSKDVGIDYREKEIVDVGCSFGELLGLIAAEGNAARSLTGLEYVRAAADAAKRANPAGSYDVYDIYEEPSRTYDIVYSTEVIEHLLRPELALRNLCKMIKPGGVAYIVVPNGRNDTFAGHVNFWGPESWDYFIRKYAGKAYAGTGYLRNDKNHLYALIRNSITEANDQL